MNWKTIYRHGFSLQKPPSRFFIFATCKIWNQLVQVFLVGFSSLLLSDYISLSMSVDLKLFLCSLLLFQLSKSIYGPTAFLKLIFWQNGKVCKLSLRLSVLKKEKQTLSSNWAMCPYNEHNDKNKIQQNVFRGYAKP